MRKDIEKFIVKCVLEVKGMIAIIDYGLGNLGSIKNMLTRIGAYAIVTSSQEIIEAADKLILPGVGSFDNAMRNLEHLGVIPILNTMVLEKRKPILGICLGMQLFSKRSEEGSIPGLGWINAETIKFRFEGDTSRLRIPHMGWNTVKVKQYSPIFENLFEESRFYFVHSYHVSCNEEANVLATSCYGITFHSAVIKENIIGTQFHPEKSHKFGMKLLQKFAEVE